MPGEEGAVVEAIMRSRPRVVGMTIAYPNLQASVRLARRLRHDIPGIVTIAGGPHITIAGESFLETYSDAFDIGISSEGEIPLLNAVLAAKNGTPVDGVPGAICMREGVAQRNPSPPNLEASRIPIPDFGEIDLRRYPLPMLPIATTRGCNRHCTFCGVVENSVTGQYRERRLQDVIEELKHGKDRHGCRIFMFTDSLLNSNPRRMRELCGMIIEERLDIAWIAEVFPDMVREDMELMHEAGCRFLWISPETGSPATARKMKKGVDLDDAARTIRDAHRSGIFVSAWFIIGFPGESREDVLQTIEYARSLKSSLGECTFSHYALMLGSQIYRNPREYEIRYTKTIHDHTVAQYFGDRSMLERRWLVGVAEELWDEFNSGRRYPMEFEKELHFQGSPRFLRWALRRFYRDKYDKSKPKFRYGELFAEALRIGEEGRKND